MSFLPTFLAGGFALAGLAFAAAPIIIHLLNRRRFRVVQWAAMDFLQHAIRRNRRILRLRDILLLILRTAIVLLFGLALAQPYFSSAGSTFDGSQPLHAVLLIDNSRSMDYVSLEGTLLDRAKAKAADFVKRLPDGSVISVAPVCGSRQAFSPDPYASKQHALDALRRIECVDRSGSLPDVVNAATQAAQAAPQMTKRYVWLTDQQRTNYRQSETLKNLNDSIPNLQILNVSDEERTNSWISDLRVQDGVADVNTPATIIVNVRHDGSDVRDDVQVSLLVDNEEVGSTTVSLSPGGSREVVFQHTFSSQQPTPRRPATAAVTATLTPDRLSADDRRQIVVHVAASTPVVFIDQFGADREDALQQRFGETRSLRRLLAPGAGSPEAPRQLVEVRHLRPAQVDRDVLADSRLVVMAGVEQPPAHLVDVLRQYVEQGGQLLVACGADFAPDKWNAEAWRDGGGILPMPLAAKAIGSTPDESDQLNPFFIDYESLQSHAYFQLSGNSREELQDLFAAPFFFKAVQSRWDADIREQWRGRELERQREALDAARDSEADTANRESRWLTWARQPLAERLSEDEVNVRAARNVTRGEPVVLASFDKGLPMLVQRQVGEGRIVFFASGLVSPWNNIAKTNCFIIFDRMLREMLKDTFPARNLPPQTRTTVGLPGVNREVNVALIRPDGASSTSPEILHSGFFDEREVVFTALQGGVYRFQATPVATDEETDENETLWDVSVAVQPDARESELAELSAEDARQLTDQSVRILAADEQISLAGAQVRGQDTWWWLALGVLLLLLTEIAILAWPRRSSPTVVGATAA